MKIDRKMPSSKGFLARHTPTMAMLLVVLLVAEGQETIIPNKDVQAVLTRLSEEESLDSAGDELVKLRELYSGDLATSLPQVLYFRAKVKNLYRQNMLGSSEMEKRLGNTYFVLLDIMRSNPEWRREILKAVIPYIRQEDPDIKEQMQWLLEKIDYAGIKKVDFTTYEDVLKDRKDNPPQGLIEYMIGRNPDRALQTLADIYLDQSERASLLRSGEAGTPPLDRLSNRSEWWARLYVAETMNKYPHLRDSAILKKLEKDDHPLIREKVAEITSGK